MKQAELDKLTADFGNHVKIDRDAITDNMIEQSSLYAYYAVAKAQALRESKLAKMSMENRRSVLRRVLDKDKDKVTEAMIDEACHHDKEWQTKSEEFIEAEYCYDVLEAITDAMKHRKEMIVNLGASLREEMRSLDMRTPTKRREDQPQYQQQFMYAVGPSESKYVNGPFDDVQTALAILGSKGHKIWVIAPDGTASARFMWDVKGLKWVEIPISATPVFTQAQIPF